MRVACLQMRSGICVDKNLDTLAQMVAQAAERGATYIQTPEMTSLVQKNPKLLFENIRPDSAEGNINHTVDFVAGLAKRHNVWLHLGSIALKATPDKATPDKAANRAMLFSPAGKRVAIYDKLHMFDVDLPDNETWRESSLYQAGDKAVVVETEEFTLGMSICYDLRFPILFQSLAVAGAQILSCPAAFTRQTGKAHWHALLRARAIENGAFVIAAAQGGRHEDGRETYGHSLIINPWGEIIAELDHDNPQVLICDIVLSEVDAARSQIPNLGNNTVFSVVKYGLE